MVDPIAGGRLEPSDAALERARAMIGRVISERYRIVELVAMGGMGAIYRAEHLLLHQEIAIKILHPEIEGFPELVARFEREAIAGAHISDPHVASAKDFGKFDGDSYFLVLEFVHGCTLRKLIEQGPLAPEKAARIAIGIAQGLCGAHAKGIIHRDIKPRNIMVLDSPGSGSPVVKLIDFGLAKVPVAQLSASAMDADVRRSLTAAGVVMGTVAYFAPETALGMRSIGVPADLYALGIIFYEMLTGLHPFVPTDPAALFAAHTKAPVPPMHERNPNVVIPPLLEAVVRRLLEKDPALRFPSARAAADAIEGALLGQTAFLPLPPAFPDQGELGTRQWFEQREQARRVRVKRILLALTTLLVVLVASAAAPASIAWLRRAGPAAVVAKRGLIGTAKSPTPVLAEPQAEPSPVDLLRQAVQSGEQPRIANLFHELRNTAPEVFSDRAIQREAAIAAEMLARDGGQHADAFFESLANDLGSHGLDILYDVLVREGAAGSAPKNLISAPARVRLLLTRQDVAARMSPAMRIALDLRTSQCGRRRFLFGRAGADGDDRALSILTAMQHPTCGPLGGGCCEKHPDLERAIGDIQSRLRN